MIEHRGAKIRRGFVGDPSWITPQSPSIGEIDRATNRGPIAFDWYDIAARAKQSALGHELPARVASQPDAAGRQEEILGDRFLGVSSLNSPAFAVESREGGAFSGRADASGSGRASKKGDAK
jgi:hypothetical protein